MKEKILHPPVEAPANESSDSGAHDEERVFCTNCGKELQKDFVACPYCGMHRQDTYSEISTHAQTPTTEGLANQPSANHPAGTGSVMSLVSGILSLVLSIFGWAILAMDPFYLRFGICFWIEVVAIISGVIGLFCKSASGNSMKKVGTVLSVCGIGIGVFFIIKNIELIQWLFRVSRKRR